MRICVEVYHGINDVEDGYVPFRQYTMDHDDKAQRRVLGEQCRNAFEAGQCVVTFPEEGS